jgi:hypothetical protein
MVEERRLFGLSAQQRHTTTMNGDTFFFEFSHVDVPAEIGVTMKRLIISYMSLLTQDITLSQFIHRREL